MPSVVRRLSRCPLLFFLLLSATFALGQAAGSVKTAEAAPAREAGDNPAARQAWFLRGRVVLGKNAAELLQHAFQQKLAIRKAQQKAVLQRAATAQAGGSATATGTVGVASVPVIGPSWTNIGPAPITGIPSRYGDASGRITALVVDPNDATGNTVYAAGAYGGVWRTINGTASPGSVQWAPLFDTSPAASTLSVGAVAVQPGNPDLILVGTGEPDNAIDSYYGQGILRSADSGATWSLVSTANAGAISFKGLGFSKLAFSTMNTASLSTNLVVAGGAQTPLGIESGLVPAGCPTCGIYYSTDAGATWHLASTSDPGPTSIQYWRVTDVVFDAVVQKFFAVIAFHGFYSSADGINWTRVADPPGSNISVGGLCPSFPTNTSGNPPCPLYRGNLAVQPSTGDLYTVFIASSTTATPQIFRANFSSMDANGQVTGWTQITITTGISSCGDGQGCGTGGQGFYDLYVAAVPNGGSTDLYFGAVNLFKCNVNGANPTCSNAGSWLNLTHVYGSCSASYHSMHPDNHALAFNHINPNLIYFGNDGGVYRTFNGSGLTTGTCSNTSGNVFDDLNTSSLGSLTQFIAISTAPTDASVTLGGTQDNGSPAIAANQTSPALNAPLWFEANDGDGGFNAIDNSGANWYTANTDVSIQKCSSGTACIESATFSQIVGNSQVGGDHGAFYTPYILDPNNQGQIIVATCSVWRGPATGVKLTRLSNNLQSGGTTVCSGQEANTVHGLAAGGTPSGGVSPVIYAGTDGGHIWATTNSTTWADTTSHAPAGASVDPGGFPIPGVAMDTTDATGATAYITVMGFTGGAGHVWKTTNAGGAWTDITGNLPDAPVNSVIIDPGNHAIIYVGTDVGVFMTTDTTLGGATTWSEWGDGLPNVAVVSLAATTDGHLRAGTHGRGTFQTDLATASDYSLFISDTPKTVYVANLPATFHGIASAVGTFSSAVTLSCAAGATAPPSPTCTPTPNPVTPTTGAGTAFTLSAGDPPNAADYLFNLHGTGGGIQHDAPVTLHVVDFSLNAAPNPINIPQGDAGNVTLTVTAAGTFTDSVLVACRTPLPAGLACSYSQNNFVPSNAGTNVNVVISTTPSTAVGPSLIHLDVTGSSAGAPTKTVDLTVNVTAGVPGLSFVAVTPCRVADTRNAAGPFGGPFISGNTTRAFPVPSSACGIPNTAQAYSVNLTVVPHGGLGFLTAYPCGQSLPLASNLNSIDGRVKAVAAIVPAGTPATNGGLCAFASSDTDLVIDIDGYFVPNTTPSTLAFYPLTPCRLVDTRLAAGPLGGPTMAGNATRTFPILSSPCNVPNTAVAYSLNYTVVPSGGLGFLTTWPAGQAQPLVSTLNAPTGTVVANAAIVPAGTSGDINVFVTSTTDVIIDINGYFAPPAAGGLSFYPLTPCRVLDTRNPPGAPPIAGTNNVNVVASGCGAPVSAQSFVLNATVVPPGLLGFLSLWPQGAAQPLVSTLNAIDATVTSNLAIVPTTNGSISAFPSNPTHLVLDISGFFAP